MGWYDQKIGRAQREASSATLISLWERCWLQGTTLEIKVQAGREEGVSGKKRKIVEGSEKRKGLKVTVLFSNIDRDQVDMLKSEALIKGKAELTLSFRT